MKGTREERWKQELLADEARRGDGAFLVESPKRKSERPCVALFRTGTARGACALRPCHVLKPPSGGVRERRQRREQRPLDWYGDV